MNTLPEINMGDFALSLVNEEVQDIKDGKKPMVNMESMQSSPEPGMIDISNISTDNFVKQISGEVVESVEISKPRAIEPSQDQNILSILLTLTEEVKALKAQIKEMSIGTTSVGSIGVNFAGALEDPNKPKEKKTKKGKKKRLSRSLGKKSRGYKEPKSIKGIVESILQER